MIALHADDLILFACIVEADSFTRASERTGMPKATLSRRLAQLENALGERLIQRSTRRLTLTEFGQRMLQHAQRLRDENDEAVALAANRQADPVGTLRVSLPPEFRQLAVSELVSRLAQRYPGVRLELDLSARRVDLIAEHVDVAVRAAAHLPDDATLVARRIVTQQSGLYASAGYLERYGTPDSPSALLDHCGLVLTAHGAPQPWQLSRGDERWEGLPRRTLAANSLGLQQELALRGLGIVELGHRFAGQAIEQGRLVRVLPDWSAPSVTIWCVTPGRRLLPRRTQVFIETLREVLTDAQTDEA